VTTVSSQRCVSGYDAKVQQNKQQITEDFILKYGETPVNAAVE
jgi:hypothetical protein